MENKLDQLFRNKLSGHMEAPSLAAWDQLQGQLASNRRKVWKRRLAIAASITILFTVGIVGYNALEGVQDSGTVELADSQDNPSEETNFTSPEEKPVNEAAEIASLEVSESEETIEIKDQPRVTPTVANNESKEEILPVTKQEPLENKLLAEVGNDMEVSGESEPMEEPKEQAPLENETIITETTLASAEEGITSTEDKEVPKVKIVYKANRDSKLVASNKNKILDKGINMITDFSDEHLLTDSRKEKLRNTKDDLLALNIGKLLNKSSKDVEN